MSDTTYYSPSGQVYNYGQSYQSQYNPKYSWQPINMNQVDYNNPPSPDTYMYGPQFGDCFIQEKSGSLLMKLFRTIFCLS